MKSSNLSFNHKILRLGDNKWTLLAAKFLYVFILLNAVILCLETVKEFNHWRVYFEVFEIVCVIVFSIEYIFHLVYAYAEGKLLKYVFSFLGLIDLISILPFYVGDVHLTFVKILRLFRMLRILKIYRYSEHIQTIIGVIRSKMEYLAAIMLTTAVVLFFCAYSTYYFEHEVQPDKFPNIFAAMWWGVATLTTIGYGDIYPITVGGKVMASILALLGIGLIAIPSGILSAGFVEVMDKRRKRGK
jgi:voltage-gated potassium channel